MSMYEYDLTRISDLEFVPGSVDQTLIPAAYEMFRKQIATDDLGEITNRQWDVIEMLVGLHEYLAVREGN